MSDGKMIDGKWWSNDMINMSQAHDYMIVNYIHKITKKWEEIQGHKINKYDELSSDAKKEIDDWYANYPRDYNSIKSLVKRNGSTIDRINQIEINNLEKGTNNVKEIKED